MTTNATGPVPPGPTRRRLLQGAAAFGGGALVAPCLVRTARAASRTLKIGMVTPETGSAAAFGEPTKWIAAAAMEALAGGIELGGETYQVEILTRDSQSAANRAAEVAASLINDAGVDLIIATSGADTVLPVADLCELNGVPCITTDNPWQIFFFARHGDPQVGFDWTYNFFFGLDQIADTFVGIWKALDTNRKVGLLLTNDADGVAATDPERGLAASFARGGFEVVDLGLYPPTSDDFSAQIAELKKQNVEIVSGLFNPPQFSIFWAQCAQQGYRPKAVTPLKAALFPSAIEALGERGAGVSCEVWWTPSHPFRSSLSGQSAAEFCAAYQTGTGHQWTQPLGFKHAAIEIAVDALRRATAPTAEAIGAALKTVSLDTIVGPVSWSARGPKSPVPNVSTTPIVGGQWVKGETFKYDLAVVWNGSAPEIPVTRPVAPIAY